MSQLPDQIPEEVTPHEFAQFVAGMITDTADEAPEVDAGAEVDTDTVEAVADATGRLHDPETGKFVPKVEDAEEDDEEELDDDDDDDEPEADGLDDEVDEDDDEPAAVFQTDDPVLQSFLEKYDGDPAKALKAAAHQTELIGRQGNELGELKAALQRMEQMVATAMAPKPELPADFDEVLDEDPETAFVVARSRGHLNGIQAALAAMAEESPAGRYRAEALWQGLLAEFERDQVAAQPAAQAEQQVDVDAVIRSRIPDIDALLPKISEEARDNHVLRELLEKGTPEQQVGALETLATLAKSRLAADTSSEAQKAARVAARRQAKDAKKSASVVSAKRTSSAEGKSRLDEFFEAFDEKLGLKVDAE